MSISATWGPHPLVMTTPIGKVGLSISAGELPAEREFHTWREAVLTAVDVAHLFTTASKPRVRWRYDRWLLTYTYRPTLMNGDTA